MQTGGAQGGSGPAPWAVCDASGEARWCDEQDVVLTLLLWRLPLMLHDMKAYATAANPPVKLNTRHWTQFYGNMMQDHQGMDLL